MSSLYAFAASLTLILPLLGQASSAPVNSTPIAPVSSPHAPACKASGGGDGPLANGPVFENAQHSDPKPEPVTSDLSATNFLEALLNSATANQYRVERRVTIRIAPYRQSNRNSLLAQLPRRGVARAYEERKMDSCVPVSGIAGVQTGTGNRLLLFLRDQRIISLNLERGCEARDFYSGFYVERNDDGRLCVKRDQLQSRSGAKCEVERMSRLVPAED